MGKADATACWTLAGVSSTHAVQSSVREGPFRPPTRPGLLYGGPLEQLERPIEAR